MANIQKNLQCNRGIPFQNKVFKYSDIFREMVLAAFPNKKGKIGLPLLFIFIKALHRKGFIL